MVLLSQKPLFTNTKGLGKLLQKSTVHPVFDFSWNILAAFSMFSPVNSFASKANFLLPCPYSTLGRGQVSLQQPTKNEWHIWHTSWKCQNFRAKKLLEFHKSYDTLFVQDAKSVWHHRVGLVRLPNVKVWRKESDKDLYWSPIVLVKTPINLIFLASQSFFLFLVYLFPRCTFSPSFWRLFDA